MSTTTSRPLASAFSATRVHTLWMTRSTSKSVGSRLILPASILEKSRMSLMMPSRWWAALLTLSSCWRWRSVAMSRRIRWVRPMMAFIGVRISWLMLARKELLERLAASAASLAAASSAVRAATSSSSWFW